MRTKFLLSAIPLLLASCGEVVRDDHFTNSNIESQAAPAESSATPSAVPVRVGELGANFDACGAQGTTRHIAPGAGLALRAAPFDNAAETGTLPAGTRFFVCSRSHDQKWLGVVAHQNGNLDEACGVSRPLSSRRAYDGPCRSGWVSSAFVRLISGVEQGVAAPANQTAVQDEGA